MADIFISYAGADRPQAKLLAEALAGQGWSVWWDRNIPYGKPYDQVIEEALDAARCVIVLWTQNSVKSDWVKNEAEEGAKRGVLLPVLLEETKIPLAFRRLQAANLSGWRPETAHGEFERMLAHIAEMLGGRPTVDRAAAPSPAATPSSLAESARLSSRQGSGARDPRHAGAPASLPFPASKTEPAELRTLRMRFLRCLKHRLVLLQQAEGPKIAKDGKRTARAAKQRQAETAAGGQRWRVKLLEDNYSSFTMRVHLTHESHVVGFVNKLSREYVTVDGVRVAEGGSLMNWKDSFKFKLRDGSAAHAACLEVAPGIGLLGMIAGIRLSIAGREIYRRGTLA